MKSPLKTIVVYDLETGGFSPKFNSITEFAGVAIDLETLEIIDEFTVMLNPRFDLSNRLEDPEKEAKALWKNLAEKDSETNIKSLSYRGEQITLKNLGTLSTDIENFYEFLDARVNVLGEVGNIFDNEDWIELEKSEHKNISKIYFNHCYNSQALEVTHITREMLVEEGVTYEEFYKKISEFFKKHTVGNNKPILAGHNIKKFDNPFLEKVFLENKGDLSKVVNSFMIDTLEWVRLRWFETAAFNLGACLNEVGLTLVEAHRALPDTIANAKLLIELLKAMRGQGTQESTRERRKFTFNF